MTAKDKVEICDVAPRDGFQVVGPWIETADKIAVVEGLVGAGFKRIETGAFVSPKAVPQMKDTAFVHAGVRRGADVRLSTLIPNVKGAELALAAGIADLVYVFSASESHNQSNVRRPTADSIEELGRVVDIAKERDDFRLRVNVATVFDCPFEGRVSEDRVYACIDKALSYGMNCEIGLCDTTGRAFPDHVAGIVEGCMTRFGNGERASWAFHGHDTFGLGIANALYAYEAGIRVFDASCAGLGGCPFAPGATGNTASEDLVFTFENMGIATGIDLAALLLVAEKVASLEGVATGGHLRTVPRKRALAAA